MACSTVPADRAARRHFDLFVEDVEAMTIWVDDGSGFTAHLRVPASEMKRVEVGDFDGDGQTELIGRLVGRIALHLSGDAK